MEGYKKQTCVREDQIMVTLISLRKAKLNLGQPHITESFFYGWI
jgi:hypothetical protein